MRYSDVFGSCHPAVNFMYFVLVIAFSMCLTHPVCLLLSVCGAVIYHAVLLGSRSLRKSAVWMVPMAVLAAVINPAFTHQGVTILAYLPSGNPLTLESMLYGLASAALLSATLLWFTCYNAVMTSDKFISLWQGDPRPVTGAVYDHALCSPVPHPAAHRGAGTEIHGP